MAATNASKQARQQNAGSAPVGAHSMPSQPGVTSGELCYTFQNREEYIEVLGAVTIQAGQASKQRDFTVMLNNVGTLTRLFWTGIRAGTITEPGIPGESPPLARSANAAT